MIQNRLVINNAGPTETIFNTVIAGTALEFFIYIEDEGQPLDTSDGEVVSECRFTPFDTAPCAQLTATPRSGSPGYIDFLLTATDTLVIGNADAHWSAHFRPNAPNEERVRPLASGVIPVRYGATR